MAIETGSSAVASVKNFYDYTRAYAWADRPRLHEWTSRRYIANQPHHLRPLRRSHQSAADRPCHARHIERRLGTAGRGAGYTYPTPSTTVNSNGLSSTGSSAIAVDGVRPGDHNASLTDALINGLRAQIDSPTMAVLMPNGVTSWAYGEVYHGGGGLTPSYGINLYNASGQIVGFVATDSGPIYEMVSGVQQLVLSPTKGQSYLFSQPGDITQGVRAATPAGRLDTDRG